MESERGVSGARVYMVKGLLTLDADSVAVTSVVAHASDIKSGLSCSWLDRKEILLIGVVGGPI